MHKNKQLIIGVTMSMDNSGFIREGINYSFIRRDYGEALNAVGAQVVYLEPSIEPEVAAELCDGIVISGGQDIDPELYSQSVTTLEALEPRLRTDWERQLIDACDAATIPILGICYGQQLLNVHYGGTLYQDIQSEHGSHMSHGTSTNAAMHKVSFIDDGLGFVKGEHALSASRHHQAVKDIAPGFEAVATADDGIVEAIKGRGHYGIQWHPEADGTATRIYGAFVSVCTSEEPVGLADFLPEPALS